MDTRKGRGTGSNVGSFRKPGRSVEDREYNYTDFADSFIEDLKMV